MDELVSYFKIRKNLVNLLLVVLLIVSLPVVIYLVRQQQILKSQAVSELIVLLKGNCVSELSDDSSGDKEKPPEGSGEDEDTKKDKKKEEKKKKDEQSLIKPVEAKGKLVATCLDEISFQLTSPIGGPEAFASPSASPSLSPSPTSSPTSTPSAKPKPTKKPKPSKSPKLDKQSLLMIPQVFADSHKDEDDSKEKNEDKKDQADKSGVTTSVKYGEKADLSDGIEKIYNQEPLIVTYTFKDKSKGRKTLFVEFRGKDKNGSDVTKKHSLSFDYLGAAPTISSISCEKSLAGQGIMMKLMGVNFGSGGILEVDGLEDSSATITSWSDTEVTASLNTPSLSDYTGKTIKVTLTRAEDQTKAEGACVVGVTPSFSLGARLFCRLPYKTAVTGVELTIISEDVAPKKYQVDIDNDGLLRGASFNFQVGKTYQVALKAPFSVRRVSQPFIYTGGTIQLILRQRDNLFNNIFYNVLPIGDIFPLLAGDGAINSFDRQILRQQWGGATSSASLKTADFNLDQLVNSVDWACMRYDFGATDDPEPTSVEPITPSPSPSVFPSPPENPSPSPTSSPQAEKCGIENCHGLDITCGTNVPDGCTELYQLGDKCRKFVSCQSSNNSCQKIVDPKFNTCKSCVEECSEKYQDDKDSTKVFECEAKCGE